MVGKRLFQAGWLVAVIALFASAAAPPVAGALFVVAGLLVIASFTTGDLQGLVKSERDGPRAFAAGLVLVLGIGWVGLGLAIALG